MEKCKPLKEILLRIESACRRVGRDPSEVTLLGATKTVSPDTIRDFFECGLKVFGENRVQEFLKKYEVLKDLNIDWHFIGRLQSNKVKYLMGKISLIHSLDRVSLAQEIQKRADKAGVVQKVLIEVNIGEEKTKGGVLPADLFDLFKYTLSLKNLKVLGLMCIPPYTENPQEARCYFSKLRELRDTLEKEFSVELPHLSMGMSHDFEIAIEEGATIVRIGTLLFGERKR